MSKQFYISLVLVHSFNDKTDLFGAILCSISKQFSSIWLIDSILSGATIPGESGPSSDGHKRGLCIPQSSIAQSAGAVKYTDCTSAEG